MYSAPATIFRVLVFLLLGWLCCKPAQAADPVPKFPSCRVRDLSESYYPFYERTKGIFSDALEGEPSAIDAFLDAKRGTDGEHAFTHDNMCQILLARVGDEVFSRHLSSRAPLVQWRIAGALPLSRLTDSDTRDKRAQKLVERLRVRYPQTTALVDRWKPLQYKEMSHLERQWLHDSHRPVEARR